VARKWVLRLMREHALLSPHRAHTRADTPHDRQIITTAPNLMWATDATQIATVQDGKVWLFGVIEHMPNCSAGTSPNAKPAWRLLRPSA